MSSSLDRSSSEFSWIITSSNSSAGPSGFHARNLSSTRTHVMYAAPSVACRLISIAPRFSSKIRSIPRRWPVSWSQSPMCHEQAARTVPTSSESSGSREDADGEPSPGLPSSRIAMLQPRRIFLRTSGVMGDVPLQWS
ncbi:hypothetical protein PoMZ_10379 [Pyricularia oryzae]|uniref:Uncharacterized protein n=1 Tax=Pyricularia oryzae TaxID=318829 RepID=A0A4P7N411_PYROR|nr:hypothetical protein PoMZ_10379 [Pyricularia oryzae]